MEEQLGSNWTERQRRFANTNLVVQAVGSKWVSSTSVVTLFCQCFNFGKTNGFDLEA